MKNTNIAQISEETALDAIAIWEAVLDRNRHDWKNKDDSFHEWFTGGEGACEGRQVALDIAPLFTPAWETISEEYGDAFDWEFVPQFLEIMFNSGKSPRELTQQAANIYAKFILLNHKEWEK